MIDEIEAYLRARRSMVVATRVDGEIRASTSCFAVGPQMILYSLVFRGSVKHRGIMQSSRVSVVIDDGFTIPMRGLEIIGTAEVLEGPEGRQGRELLTKRFPDLEGMWDDPRVLVLRITPDRVRYTDWVHGIGQSREASLTPRRSGERLPD